MENMFSPTTGKLAEALAKAQAEIPDAVKDSKNTAFSSKYADYAALKDACSPSLSKNGLSVLHPLENREGAIVIHTLLLHVSGEWVRSELAIVPAKKLKRELLKDPFQSDMIPTIDAAAIGAAVGNGKRIGLSALLGLTATDEEREEGSPPPPPVEEKPKKQMQPSNSNSHNDLHKDQPKSLPPDWRPVNPDSSDNRASAIKKQIQDRLGEMYAGDWEVIDQYLHTISIEGEPCSVDSIEASNVAFLAKLFNLILKDYVEFKKVVK